MAKITLDTALTDYGAAKLNANFQKIANEFNNKVLYRDNPVGEPNTPTGDYDYNGKNLFNANEVRATKMFVNGVELSIVSASSSALATLLSNSSGSNSVGFIQEGNGVIANTSQDKMREYKSVLDFMTNAQRADAKSGTPSLDHTAAVQSALSSGFDLFIPSGLVLRLTNTVTASTRYQRIYGGGRFKQVTSNKAILLVTADNVTVEGLQFENTGTANGTALPSSYGSGVILKDNKEGRVVNCYFKNCSSTFGSAIWLTDAQDSFISGNQIDGAFHAINTDSFFGIQPSKNNLILNNIARNVVNGIVLDLNGGQNANNLGDTIQGNIIYSPSSVGIVVDGAFNGATVDGNLIRSPGTDGIQLVHNSNRVLIARNHVHSAVGIGLVINGIDGSVPSINTIENNIFEACVQDGIQLYTVDRTVLSNNQIISNGRFGIFSVSGSFPRNLKIGSNIIHKNGRDGISLTDANDIGIFHNSIYENGQSASNTYSGIKLANASLTPSNITIDFNTFYLAFPGFIETHQYAINNTMSSSANCRVIGNYYGSPLTAALFDPNGALYRAFSGTTQNFSLLNMNGGRMFGSPSIPVSGSYTQGDIVFRNGVVTIQGSGGSQYTVLGWRRLTTGTSHVLNTDWVEMRTLTGT